MARATGKHAFGFCDRSGFRYPLSELVDEYVNGSKTGLRIGKDIAEADHPQNFIGRVNSSDSISLDDPRPDLTKESLHGFDPVGNPAEYMQAMSGRVTVTTE
jgi:hypothetical protein